MTFLWTWQATRRPLALLPASSSGRGGQVFPLILSLPYLSSLSHQGHSTRPRHLPPLTTTRSPRWKIMCCDLLPDLKTPHVLFLYSPPPLLLSVPQQRLDARRSDGLQGKNLQHDANNRQLFSWSINSLSTNTPDNLKFLFPKWALSVLPSLNNSQILLKKKKNHNISQYNLTQPCIVI